MRATLRYVLITALRDRFAGALLLAIAAAVGIGGLMGAAAIAEGHEMALAYAGTLVRLILVLGLVTFICFHVRRMHENREIEAILARPISRGAFVLAYYAAFAAVALPLALIAAPVLVMALGAGGLGLAEWEASLMLECLIVVALALFCAMTLESAAVAVMAALGFYALGRSAEYLVEIARHGTGYFQSQGATGGAHWVMEIIAAVMPRLDLFGQSRWLVSGPGGQWGAGELALQAAIYVPLLLLATIRDLKVKRF